MPYERGDGSSCLPPHLLFQSLANHFASIARFSKPLRTFALGALVHDDIHLGEAYDRPKDYDILKLRIYYVEYNVSTIGKSSVECKEVATGTWYEAEGICPNIDILKACWLA